MDEEEEETVHHVVESACNEAAGRNYMFKRFSKFISSMKVAYLHCKNNEFGNSDDDIDTVLINFESSNDIRFTTLSDVPRQEFFNDGNFSETKKNYFKTIQLLFLPLKVVMVLLSTPLF